MRSSLLFVCTAWFEMDSERNTNVYVSGKWSVQTVRTVQFLTISVCMCVSGEGGVSISVIID